MNKDYILLDDKKYKITEALIDALMEYFIKCFEKEYCYNPTIDTFIKNTLPYHEKYAEEYVDKIKSDEVRNVIFDVIRICIKNVLKKYAEDTNGGKDCRNSRTFEDDKENDINATTKYKVEVKYFQYREVEPNFIISVSYDISNITRYRISRVMPVNNINDYLCDNHINLEYYE